MAARAGKHGGARRLEAALIYSKFKENIERINACIVTQCLYEKGLLRSTEKAAILTSSDVNEAVGALLDAVSQKGDVAVTILRDVVRSVAEESLMLAKNFNCSVDEAEHEATRQSAQFGIIPECRKESSTALIADDPEKSGEGITSPEPQLTQPSESHSGSQEDRAQELERKLEDTIVVNRPAARYDDVIGLHEAKEALKTVLAMPLRFPQLFVTHHVSWSGVLLFGPAGSGKTLLAKAVASEVPEYRFIAVSSASLVTRCQGGRQLVTDLFALARSSRPCVLFLDDIDVFGSSVAGNHENTREVKDELVRQMDGICKEASSIVVLAATSIPWMLDPTITKRFEKKIYVPLPDAEARSGIIRLHLAKTAASLSEADWRRLGDDTKGFSAADLICLARSALMVPIREICSATHFRYARDSVTDSDTSSEDVLVPCSNDAPGALEMSWTAAPPEKIRERPVTMDDILAALRSTQRSVDDAEVALQEQFAQTNCSR